MKNKFLTSILIALFFASCTNLDNEIYDKIPLDVFPENEGQVAALSNPTYAKLDLLTQDWGGWWMAQEITSDEVVCPTRGEHWDDGGKWRVLHSHEWNNNTEAVNVMWSTFYDGVYQSNFAIDMMRGFAQSEALDVSMAKLRAMRALYYWFLIDNYGDVPFLMTNENAPEKPFRIKRAEIFQAIVTDLEDAVKSIPAGGAKTAASKGMAYTLLAKLYLNAEVYTGTPQWAKTEMFCDSVIALNQYSLEVDPLGPFITENGSSPENIFTIPYDEDNMKGFNLHMRTLHYNNNSTFNMTVGPWNGFAVVEKHFKTYFDDYSTLTSSDDRIRYFLYGQQYNAAGQPLMDGTTNEPLVLNPFIPALIMGDANTEAEKLMSGARVVKFEIKDGCTDNLSNDYPIFRYADVLLMKAECRLRQGDAGGGLTYVNQVRQRAGAANFTALTEENLLAERGREMFWEANRRQDMIRFGTFISAFSWDAPSTWSRPASGTDRLTFPIPQWAIDANENLTAAPISL